MRKVNINFTAEKMLPDGDCLGKKGELNATELIITPPAELAENDDVAGYIIAFQIGVHRTFRTELIEKTSPLTYKLPIETTQANMISIQLEGYDSNESLIVKSSVVDGLYFEPSVCGEEITGNSKKSLISDIAANTLSRHTHENKDIIDKLSEDNGTLAYNGKSIGGSGERPTATKTFSFDEMILYPDSMTISECLTVISTDAIEDIPVGTEIKTIEFKRENGEWVDIHGMFEIDDVPYILNMHKVYFSEQYQTYFYAIVSFAGQSINAIANETSNYMITETRITYYTD